MSARMLDSDRGAFPPNAVSASLGFLNQDLWASVFDQSATPSTSSYTSAATPALNSYSSLLAAFLFKLKNWLTMSLMFCMSLITNSDVFFGLVVGEGILHEDKNLLKT